METVTLLSDERKAAEARGYNRGYAAGRRKRKRDDLLALADRRREAFIDKAFLAIFAWAFTQEGWGVTVNGERKNYRSIEERTEFAWKLARRAWDLRRIY